MSLMVTLNLRLQPENGMLLSRVHRWKAQCLIWKSNTHFPQLSKSLPDYWPYLAAIRTEYRRFLFTRNNNLLGGNWVSLTTVRQLTTTKHWRLCKRNLNKIQTNKAFIELSNQDFTKIIYKENVKVRINIAWQQSNAYAIFNLCLAWAN